MSANDHVSGHFKVTSGINIPGHKQSTVILDLLICDLDLFQNHELLDLNLALYHTNGSGVGSDIADSVVHYHEACPLKDRYLFSRNGLHQISVYIKAI